MHSSTAERSAKSGRLVIVAIQDRAQREKTCEFLRQDGFAVVPAQSCQYALTACRSAATDPVLVAEIRLPEMWGLDLARAATQFHFKTLVICISERQVRRECQDEMNERGWMWLKNASPEIICQAIRENLTPAASRHKPSHAFTGIPGSQPQSRDSAN
jgi:DNA-binding NtrC family response regulator